MEKLVEINNVRKYYPIYGGIFRRAIGQVRAVDNISLTIHRGETVGIVGESGCGKSTLGRCLLRLQPVTEGQILFSYDQEMRDIFHLNRSESFSYAKKMQIVFQDPYASISPTHTVLDTFDEPLRIHGVKSAQQRKDLVAELFELVNLQPDYMYRYPHEFSGGQRQRICIARALCLNPEMLVLDEPVSSLDVSIQAQVLNLLLEIQRDKQLTYLFIAHDLSVVEYMSTRIAVMYLGRIVEQADSKTLYQCPLHPYTKALLSAVPVPDIDIKTERILLEGDVPSPAKPPSGCHFHPRCPIARPECSQIEPEMREIRKNHFVACHYAEEGESSCQNQSDSQ